MAAQATCFRYKQACYSGDIHGPSSTLFHHQLQPDNNTDLQVSVEQKFGMLPIPSESANFHSGCVTLYQRNLILTHMMAQIRLPARRISKGDAGHHSRDTTMFGERIWVTEGRVSRGLACPGLDPGLLRSARGTSTKLPIAPSQNPWKRRSYESILSSFGITQWAELPEEFFA